MGSDEGIMKGHFESKWGKALWQAGLLVLLASLWGLAFNALRPDGMALVRDWSEEASPASPEAETVSAVSLEEAEELYFTGGAFFLDARSPDRFMEGRVAGAFNLPPEVAQGSPEEIPPEIPRDAPVVAYCDGESCGLSRDLASILAQRGYTDVRVLENGWTLWEEAGLPVEGDAPPS